MLKYVYAAVQNPNQYINKLGKYLNKEIDGAYKMKFGPTYSEVYVMVYFQEWGQPQTFDEVSVKINITSYQDKLRVNFIRDDEKEKTLGQVILKASDITTGMPYIKEKVDTALVKAMEKEFGEYQFIY